MSKLTFDTDRQVLPIGGRLTFSKTSSRALHVLVPGRDALPRSQPGTSFRGASGHRVEVGDRWTTPPWTTPGTLLSGHLHPPRDDEPRGRRHLIRALTRRRSATVRS